MKRSIQTLILIAPLMSCTPADAQVYSVNARGQLYKRYTPEPPSKYFHKYVGLPEGVQYKDTNASGYSKPTPKSDEKHRTHFKSPIPEAVLARANMLFPSVSQQRERTNYIIEEMRAAADRQAGHSYSLKLQ